MTFNHRKITIYIIGFTLFFLLLITVFIKLGFIINVTFSYPRGIYKTYGIEKNIPLEKDKLVKFCPKDNFATLAFKKDGWIKIGGCGEYMPLIKAVKGVEGDTIFVDYSGVYINDVFINNSELMNSTYLSFNLPYEISLKKDEYWLMSDYNNMSFDSRYIGIININEIEAYAKPIYTP